jgi:hypothetical protein
MTSSKNYAWLVEGGKGGVEMVREGKGIVL